MRCLLFFLLVVLASGALAHRVNLFAMVERAEVVVEASYSKSKPVVGGTILVYDGVSGEPLFEGHTNDAGILRFPIPAAAPLHGLTLVLHAGEGHQATWTMDASEFGSPATPTPAPGASPSPPRELPPAPPASAVDPAALDAAVRAALHSELPALLDARLDAKLAPLRRVLLEDNGPRLHDILGGIGWIVGLVGIAAYFKSRHHVR